MPVKKSSSKALKNHYVKNFFIIFLSFAITLLIINQFVDLNPSWSQPQTKKSEKGVLNVTLNTKNQKVKIGNKEIKSNVWNGQYIADTWEVKGGDKIKVKFINDMQQPTNLHFHGGHVSPKGNSDNVLLMIKPGETFDYEYNLPKSHPPGLYWYHPHLHNS
jgi:FtsP/CotA-like multicopper oxidase with cupredoxin domain